MKDIVLPVIREYCTDFDRSDSIKVVLFLAFLGGLYALFLLIFTPWREIVVDFINSIWWLILPIGLIVVVFTVYYTQKEV